MAHEEGTRTFRLGFLLHNTNNEAEDALLSRGCRGSNREVYGVFSFYGRSALLGPP